MKNKKIESQLGIEYKRKFLPIAKNFKSKILENKYIFSTNSDGKKYFTSLRFFTLTEKDLKQKNRIIRPNDDKMKEIEMARKNKSFVIVSISLDDMIHGTKFISFGHKSVIFDFKKLLGLVDFITIYTDSDKWVNHKFTSYMPSITYRKQNIIHLAYHSDFLYIYHTPESFKEIDKENARELVAKIPNPHWVKEDVEENRIDTPYLEMIAKYKSFEIKSNDSFFSKSINSVPNSKDLDKKNSLLKSLSAENNEKTKNELINYIISDAWYENESLRNELMLFLNKLVVRHLFLIAVYSVYEIEKGIKSVKPEFSELLKAGLLNKDIKKNLMLSKDLKSTIWVGETFHGLDTEEVISLCELLDQENINPKISLQSYKKQYEAYKEDLNDHQIEHAKKLSNILEDPEFRVLGYIRAFLCSIKKYLVPYGYLGNDPLAYYNCMLDKPPRKNSEEDQDSKENYLAKIRNKLYTVCYLPGFLSSVIADDEFIKWYSKEKENKSLYKDPYLKKLYNSNKEYIEDFIDLEIVELLKQTSSTLKPHYIPVAFRYGSFASTTALIRSNANVSNRMEFELYDSPQRLHNRYTEKEKSIMPKSINKSKDHSIDNGMSLFSLNLTNNRENGLRRKMLEVAQLYNLDFKVGISGNLDQAMTQALLLGMATKKGDIDEDQVLYMTYLYCIFMAHSIDHTVDEILMSSNTFLHNQEKYPIRNIADFFERPLFKLNEDKKFKEYAQKYKDSLKPTSKSLKENYINRINSVYEVYEDIYNFNCLYSSLSEGSLYNLLSTHSERNVKLTEQYSRKKKSEISGGVYGGKNNVNSESYNKINQYKQFVKKEIYKNRHEKEYNESVKDQIDADFDLHSKNKDDIRYLKYNFKDKKFDVVNKIKVEKEKKDEVYTKKQNTRYCYGYINHTFAKNRITTFYRIKDKNGKYLVDLHDEKYSFKTAHSDDKIYRVSAKLLDNKTEFNKVAKDIVTSYGYISFDRQKEHLVKNFGKKTTGKNYELWTGLSYHSISCFCAINDFSTEESANAFIDKLYYLKLMQLYYNKTVSLLIIDEKRIKSKTSDTDYFLPRKHNLMEYIEKALTMASKPVKNRFLIILNIYNSDINKSIINLICNRLPIIYFSKNSQYYKLECLQYAIHEKKLSEYNKKYEKVITKLEELEERLDQENSKIRKEELKGKIKNKREKLRKQQDENPEHQFSKIKFKAWFESIFNIFNDDLCPDYIKDTNSMIDLAKSNNIILNRDLNIYEMAIKIITRTLDEKKLFEELTNDAKYENIKRLFNDLSLTCDNIFDSFKNFEKTIEEIEAFYEEVNNIISYCYKNEPEFFCTRKRGSKSGSKRGSKRGSIWGSEYFKLMEKNSV